MKPLRKLPLLATAIASAGLLVTATIFTTPGAASAAAAGPTAPTLHWHACDKGFQCATATVPLDYQQPHGPTISIAVIRHQATDPTGRLGSLFFNGGGPSAQIADFPAAYTQFPAAVREHYDLITFDPRGFGASTAVRCQASPVSLPPFPVGASQIATWDQALAKFDASCARDSGPLLDHDTTADVARDLNLLREAVGDPVLNYVGLSYGSALGATYANLFPATTGRLILDGNVNPAAWSGGTLPFFMREHSGRASAAAMTAFLNRCGATTTARCAFSAGSPAATRAKWATLLNRLKQHPVKGYTYADVIASVPLGQVAAWPAAAAQLQQLWTASGSTGTASAPAAPTTQLTSSLGQNLAVLCSDTGGPRRAAAYTTDAGLAYAKAGGFGLEWAWTTEACADWSDGGAPDRYTGPWNRPTASTLLLLGNTGDPALPYSDSVAMSRDLARARLLTVDGYGHTEASNPSTCAIDYEAGYLLRGTLPPAGAVCQENEAPFAAPPAS